MNDTSNMSRKTCSKCGVLKPLTDFAKRASASDGRKSACKTCHNRAYAEKQPDTPRRALLRLGAFLKERGYKRCPYCKRIKPATKDYYNLNTAEARDGFQTYCRSCEGLYSKSRLPQRRIASRKWAQANRRKTREYKARWKRNNPEKRRVYDRRRRSRKYNLPNTFTPDQWQQCLDYFEHKCAVCGRAPDLFIQLHLDHWIPLSRPETLGNVAKNIVPLCGRKVVIDCEPVGCNQSKSDKLPKDWLLLHYSAAKTAEILKRIAAYFQQLK